MISLLLAAVPSGPDNSSSSSSKLSAWTAVLQAAVYEGALGGVSLLLLSGRWSLWLLLWEVWLAWVFYGCCYSTSRTPWSVSSSSSSGAAAVQAGTDSRNTLQGSGIEGSVAVQQEPCWLQQLPLPVVSTATAAVAAPVGEPAAASRGQLQVVVQHVFLALLHLLLPVVLAAAGLWC